MDLSLEFLSHERLSMLSGKLAVPRDEHRDGDGDGVSTALAPHVEGSRPLEDV